MADERSRVPVESNRSRLPPASALSLALLLLVSLGTACLRAELKKDCDHGRAYSCLLMTRNRESDRPLYLRAADLYVTEGNARMTRELHFKAGTPAQAAAAVETARLLCQKANPERVAKLRRVHEAAMKQRSHSRVPMPARDPQIDAPADCDLVGRAYWLGHGVAEDRAEAVQWFERGCRLQDPGTPCEFRDQPALAGDPVHEAVGFGRVSGVPLGWKADAGATGLAQARQQLAAGKTLAAWSLALGYLRKAGASERVGFDEVIEKASRTFVTEASATAPAGFALMRARRAELAAVEPDHPAMKALDAGCATAVAWFEGRARQADARGLTQAAWLYRAMALRYEPSPGGKLDLDSPHIARLRAERKVFEPALRSVRIDFRLGPGMDSLRRAFDAAQGAGAGFDVIADIEGTVVRDRKEWSADETYEYKDVKYEHVEMDVATPVTGSESFACQQSRQVCNSSSPAGPSCVTQFYTGTCTRSVTTTVTRKERVLREIPVTGTAQRKVDYRQYKVDVNGTAVFPGYRLPVKEEWSPKDSRYVSRHGDRKFRIRDLAEVEQHVIDGIVKKLHETVAERRKLSFQKRMIDGSLGEDERFDAFVKAYLHDRQYTSEYDAPCAAIGLTRNEFLDLMVHDLNPGP